MPIDRIEPGEPSFQHVQREPEAHRRSWPWRHQQTPANQGGKDLASTPLPVTGEVGCTPAVELTGEKGFSEQREAATGQTTGGNLVVHVELHSSQQLRWLKKGLHEPCLVDASVEEEANELPQSLVRQRPPTVQVTVPRVVRASECSLVSFGIARETSCGRPQA